MRYPGSSLDRRGRMGRRARRRISHRSHGQSGRPRIATRLELAAIREHTNGTHECRFERGNPGDGSRPSFEPQSSSPVDPSQVRFARRALECGHRGARCAVERSRRAAQGSRSSVGWSGNRRPGSGGRCLRDGALRSRVPPSGRHAARGRPGPAGAKCGGCDVRRGLPRRVAESRVSRSIPSAGASVSRRGGRPRVVVASRVSRALAARAPSARGGAFPERRSGQRLQDPRVTLSSTASACLQPGRQK
jgi:hypothetical protein